METTAGMIGMNRQTEIHWLPGDHGRCPCQFPAEGNRPAFRAKTALGLDVRTTALHAPLVGDPSIRYLSIARPLHQVNLVLGTLTIAIAAAGGLLAG